jgi:hypothetical protein
VLCVREGEWAIAGRRRNSLGWVFPECDAEGWDGCDLLRDHQPEFELAWDAFATPSSGRFCAPFL